MYKSVWFHVCIVGGTVWVGVSQLLSVWIREIPPLPPSPSLGDKSNKNSNQNTIEMTQNTYLVFILGH